MSAVGLSRALDMVTHPGYFLPSLEKRGLVFWSPPESRSQRGEQRALAPGS